MVVTNHLQESAIAALLCAGVFAGCAGKKETGQAKPVPDSFVQESGMQPGAKVEWYIDEDGNRQMSYTNSDGSGGGGVEIA